MQEEFRLRDLPSTQEFPRRLGDVWTGRLENLPYGVERTLND